jgi:hypothetical protein
MVAHKAFDTMKIIPMPIGVSIQIILEVSDRLSEKLQDDQRKFP